MLQEWVLKILQIGRMFWIKNKPKKSHLLCSEFNKVHLTVFLMTDHEQVQCHWVYVFISNYKTFDHNVMEYTNNKKRLWILLFLKKRLYRYIMVNPLLKCATLYTLCMYTPFLFSWKYRGYSFTCIFYYFIFSVTCHIRQMFYKCKYCLRMLYEILYIYSLINFKSGIKHCIIVWSVWKTDQLKHLGKFFDCFKTFEKWWSNFNFREATLIVFVFRDSYKKCETTSESLYILKRLSGHLNKLVKSQK